jgi:hypothetical protein
MARFDYKQLQLELLRDGCPEEMSSQALIRWARLIHNMLLWSLQNSELQLAQTLLPIAKAQLLRTGNVCQGLASPLEEELSAYDRMCCFELAGILEESYLMLDADEASQSAVPDFVNDELLQRLQHMMQ